MNKGQSSIVRTAIATLLCASPILAPVSAEQGGDAIENVSIPGGEMDAALKTLARQTGLQLLYDRKTVEGMTTKGVKGAKTLQDAVSQLLDGTTLRTKLDSSGAILIVAPAAAMLPGDRSGLQLEGFLVARMDAQTLADSNQATSNREADNLDQALEEVIVTARKTKERLQDVPVSVTAFSGNQLKDLGATDIKDILLLTPGFSYQSTERGLSRYNIRGINSDAGFPTVGIFVDDIPLTTGQSAENFVGAYDPIFFDIARVEVLKGPQGTLYGGSAMGGAIKYVTARPDPSGVSGEVATSVGSTRHGGESYHVEAVGNIPLIQDKLAFRGGLYYLHEGGYIDNVANGSVVLNANASTSNFPVYTPPQVPTLSSYNKQNYNAADTFVARASLLWEPDSTFSIRPTFHYQEGNAESPGQFFTNMRELTSSFRSPQKTPDHVKLYTLDVEKQVGGVQLTSLTGYFDRDQVWVRDYSYIVGNIFPNLYTFNSLAEYAHLDKQFSQEIRLSSSADSTGPLQWTIGAYYSKLKNGTTGPVHTYGAGLDDDLFVDGITNSSLEQKALFGEATYHITDALGVTLGARYFNIRSDTDIRFAFAVLGQDLDTAQPIVLESKEDGINPKVGLEYQINPDHLVYATASKGFRPGGSQLNTLGGSLCDASDLAEVGYDEIPSSWTSDSLWSYEFGSKNEFAGGRLRLNASAFYSDWKDIQQTILLIGCGNSFTDNAGEARVRGADIDIQARLAPGFNVGGTAAYMSAEISQAPAGSITAVGDTIIGVPEWMFSAFADLTVPLSAKWDISFRANYQYRAKSRRSYNKTFAVAFADGPNVIDNPFEFQVGYDVANAHIAFENELTTIRFFANNLFDSRPILDRTAFQAAATTIRPRNFGVEVRRAF